VRISSPQQLMQSPSLHITPAQVAGSAHTLKPGGASSGASRRCRRVVRENRICTGVRPAQARRQLNICRASTGQQVGDSGTSSGSSLQACQAHTARASACPAHTHLPAAKSATWERGARAGTAR
jgi:hypothetical protein